MLLSKQALSVLDQSLSGFVCYVYIKLISLICGVNVFAKALKTFGLSFPSAHSTTFLLLLLFFVLHECLSLLLVDNRFPMLQTENIHLGYSKN